MAEFDADELVLKVSKDSILKIKNELTSLFNMEVKSRDIYFQELRKFEGLEFETIKWLSEQEEKHVQILQNILNIANISVKAQRTDSPKFDSDTNKIILFDIAFEDEAVKQYTSAAANSSGPLSELLLGLMQEEVIHVQRLKKYIL